MRGLTVKLGDICLVRRGTTITQKQAVAGDVPVVAGGLKPTYFHNTPNRFNTSITVSGSGANAGYVNLWKQPIFASDCSTLEVNDSEVEITFIYYFLLSKQEYIFSELRSGAAQPHVYAKDIAEIQISLPALPIQQKIVEKLDAIFAEIDLAAAVAEANAKNAYKLFESYFQNIFNKNDSIGWDRSPLKELCDLKSGTTINKSLEKIEGDVLYVKVGDMNLPENAIEIVTSSRFVDSREILMNQIIPEGAIIFPKRGGAIATNKKRKIIKPTIVDLNTMALIPSKRLNKDYLFHWFQLFDLNTISNGANVPQINNYSFDKTFVSYPVSLEAQAEIVEKLDALSYETKKIKELCNRKVKELHLLKNSILQQAFNGELVKD